MMVVKVKMAQRANGTGWVVELIFILPASESAMWHGKWATTLPHLFTTTLFSKVVSYILFDCPEL